MTIVFLDMDGVIANWTKAVTDSLGIDYPSTIDNWQPGVYDTATQLGITDSYMWSKIDNNRTFWEDIELYDYSIDLVKKLKSKYEVHICSSPARHHACMGGKDKWLKKYFRFERNFIFTAQKHLLAQPGRILIDDLDKNIDRFNSHGGFGLLFPQKWNSLHELSNINKIEYVIKELEKYHE